MEHSQGHGAGRRSFRFVVFIVALATASAGLAASAWATPDHQPSGVDVIHGAAGVGNAKGRPSHGGPPPSNNLSYRSGAVETQAGIYLVFWGSQWSSDPSGEAAYLQRFYHGLFGDSDTWSTSTTQYCSGVASGATTCPSTANLIQHPGIDPLRGTWSDSGAAAPSRPTQAQLAGEAIRAAANFGNTTSASNANVQYVIATAHGNSSSGFGVQYCAWHSSTTSTYGSIAYTNLPYMTDAGASCGQSFVNQGTAGLLDGASIVGGHEYAETVTDPFPSSGWLDNAGAENGDKCAWLQPGQQGAASNIHLTTGTFAVQSLWSNNFNSGSGGCVISYANNGGVISQH